MKLPGRPLAASLVATVLVAAACAGAASPPPERASPFRDGSSAPSPTSQLATAPPGTAEPASGPPIAPATPEPRTQAPRAAPTEAARATAEPRRSAPTLTVEERGLELTLREDAQQGCTPRRSQLPPGAAAGVECRSDATIVDRVGVYSFPDSRSAAVAYLERLDRAGVAPDSGDCLGGSSGDRSWLEPRDEESEDEAEDYVAVDGRRLLVGRIGCFLDEDGTANVRATCYEYYIGAVGTNVDLAGLTAWVMRVPNGEPYGNAPGICFGLLGGGLEGPDVEEGPNVEDPEDADPTVTY